MKKMAEEHQPQLPTSAQIWWRAQILKKQEARARVERPMQIMRRVAVAICAVLITALLASQGRNFSVLLESGGLMVVFAISAAVIFLLSFAVLLWPALRERPSRAQMARRKPSY
jgi:hypothetical protein